MIENLQKLQDIKVSLNDEQKLDLLKTMLESRLGDQREKNLIRQGKGWFHISGAGHEALAAFSTFLRSDDYCAPYYRDRALMLTRGISNYDIATNFFGKKDSTSGGRQLPNHFSDRSKNVWSHASPVASHLLPACGLAWGISLDKKDSILLASLGEAATRQGDFFEAICFAKEKKLPVIFIVEDNKLGISTHNEKTNPLYLKAVNPEEWIRVDGSNVYAVHQAAEKLVEHTRGGNGPAFLWVDVERMESHSIADDHRKYRSQEDIEAMSDRDPLRLFKEQLIEEGVITADDYESLEKKLKEAVRQDYLKAEKQRDPKPEDTFQQLTDDSGLVEAPPVKLGKKSRMIEAVNLTLRAALEKDEDCVLYGQDIEDPKGGVFNLTVGLSTDYPERVNNAPVAESTIVGVACGLAAYGKKAVFEIQFIDFISPGWNQLVSNLATIRWRTFGDWECPAVIYAPCGAYLPGGAIWHSQSNEGLFAAVPGLKVVMPSSPKDCASLMWTAIHDKDPVIFLIPKHSMWTEQATEGELEALPLGQSRVIKEGDELTVVTWGNCLEIVSEVSENVPDRQVEILDLRSIMPWDSEGVKRSLRKTGRLLIVHEDPPHCSVGQMILANLAQDDNLWKSMKAPPVMVSRENVHIGLNPIYEYAALPDKTQIQEAIDKLLNTELIKRETTRFAELTSDPKVATEILRKGDAAQVPGGNVQKIQVPILGEGIQTARVVSIVKNPGDTIEHDDPLCELETDKAVFPVESSLDGVLKSWSIAVGDEVEVGQEIGEIEVELSEEDLVAQTESQIGDMATPIEPEAPAPRKILSSLINKVFNSEGEREKKSGLSSEIIQQMQGIVPATITIKATWDPIREARKKAKAKYGKKAPSPSAMIAWNAVQAMKNHEMFTFTVAMDKLQKDTGDFDLGIAVSLPDDELASAVVKNANQLSWDEFTNDFISAIQRARRGQFDPKTRAPLMLSTMGPFDVISAVPVVVPPAIATLFIGGSHIEPVVNNKGPHTVREVVNLTLTFDHRWINGVGSASFLTEVRDNIENFKLPD